MTNSCNNDWIDPQTMENTVNSPSASKSMDFRPNTSLKRAYMTKKPV